MSIVTTLLSGGLAMGIVEAAVLDAKYRRNRQANEATAPKPKRPKVPKPPTLSSAWERNPPVEVWKSPAESASDMLARKRAEKPQPHDSPAHICNGECE